MYQEEYLRKRKIIIRTAIILGVTILLIAIFSIITIISRSGKIKVTIDFEPRDAQVYLNNNHKNINHSTLYLTEGEYTISAFSDGFLYQTEQYDINPYNTEIVEQLIPIGASRDEVDTYLQQFDQQEHDAALKKQQKLQQTYPILKYLPYSTKSRSYSIVYTLNDDYTKLKISIDPQKSNDFIALNSACDTIKNFDPNLSISEYDIIVNNFTNIFENQFTDNYETDPIRFLKTGFNSVNNIKIETGKEKDGYYYTMIKNIISIPNSDQTDYIPYYVVLKKENNKWSLAGTPNLILTTYNTDNVPPEILNLANYYNPAEEK